MRFSAIFLLSCPPGKSHPQVYQEGIEQMVAAEALGFHTLWLTEHHFSAYGGSPDPMLMAIAAAHRTKPCASASASASCRFIIHYS